MKVKVKLRLLELYDELKMELEENLTVRSLLKKLKDKSELILLLPLLQVDKLKNKKTGGEKWHQVTGTKS